MRKGPKTNGFFCVTSFRYISTDYTTISSNVSLFTAIGPNNRRNRLKKATICQGIRYQIERIWIFIF